MGALVSPSVLHWARRLLTGLGLAMVLQSCWVPVKALLAQQLIASAYARGQTEGTQQAPWPWADTWPVARLVVPRLGIERYVLADASPRTLAFGPGMVDSVPGTQGGLSVAGHRDTHFAFLGSLQAGDEVRWEDRHGERRFRLERREIADVRRHWLSAPLPGELQLSTCWPLTDWQPGGPLRLVWVAVQVA